MCDAARGDVTFDLLRQRDELQAFVDERAIHNSVAKTWALRAVWGLQAEVKRLRGELDDERKARALRGLPYSAERGEDGNRAYWEGRLVNVAGETIGLMASMDDAREIARRLNVLTGGNT